VARKKKAHYFKRLKKGGDALIDSMNKASTSARLAR
jgi:hypothetical protein